MRINARLDKSRSRKLEVLSESGFIGCGEASPDLSQRYKEAVRDLVAAKHDHR